MSGRDEVYDGTPLLKPVMKHGRRVEGAMETLDDQVVSASEAIATLPERIRSLAPISEVPVVISDFLKALQRDTLERVRRA
ncbi:MAG TPA: hypothetical protein VIN33_03295 [Marinobacter sp.]